MQAVLLLLRLVIEDLDGILEQITEILPVPTTEMPVIKILMVTTATVPLITTALLTTMIGGQIGTTHLSILTVEVPTRTPTMAGRMTEWHERCMSSLDAF